MFTMHFHKNVNNNLQQMHFQYIYCISTSTCGYTINILKVHLLEVIIYLQLELSEILDTELNMPSFENSLRANILIHIYQK